MASMDIDHDEEMGGAGGGAGAAPVVVSASALSAAASAATAAAVAAASGDGSMDVDDGDKPAFPAAKAKDLASGRVEYRRVRVPPHRYTPLQEVWDEVVKYVVEHMKLQIRMNTKKRMIELKTSQYTDDPGSLQKVEDFLRAFMMGFDLADAVAMLRLDDLYLDSFEVTDVKMLKGDHLSRAIGRIAGQGGKTRYAIENATRTRIVVADSKVHILGAYANIKVAKDTICSLIMGAPPGKVYNQMRHVAGRLQQRR